MMAYMSFVVYCVNNIFVCVADGGGVRYHIVQQPLTSVSGLPNLKLQFLIHVFGLMFSNLHLTVN